MSGGIAYVFDELAQFSNRCNMGMVQLMNLEDAEEVELIKNMIFRHAELTGSVRATEILLTWDQSLTKFVRVMPNDYLRVIKEAVSVAAA
jgi:glutamate synthase domain-containing protein 3